MKKCIPLILILALLVPSVPLVSAPKPAKEVASLIEIARSRLKKLIEEGAKEYGKDEIEKIETYIKDAEKTLKEDEELAYYKISIGMAYFRKIEAKRELLEAENRFNDLKKQMEK